MRSNNTPILAAALAGLALGGIHAGPALAQDGFQLPPPSGETGPVQGPVAEGVPPPRAPTPTPTPAPAPSPAETEAIEQEASPPPVIAPIEIPPASRPEAAAPARDAVPASPGETGTQPGDTERAEAGDTEANATEAGSGSASQTRTAPYPAQIPLGPAPEEASVEAGGTAIPWTLIALILLALGGAGSALWWWRRESTGKEVLIIPTIQRPRPVDRQLHTEPAPKPAPAPAAASLEAEEDAGPVNPLRIALEPRQLRLSLVNATLSYRLMLTNSGDVPLTDIAIRGDMISAHSSLPREQQIAGPDLPLEPIQTIDRLAPGESCTVRGEFRLPLPMIRPIRRGDMALFVPLARLSIAARSENGDRPTVITSVVGQIPQRGANGLQPFRLDLGPRTYSDLSQRAFA